MGFPGSEPLGSLSKSGKRARLVEEHNEKADQSGVVAAAEADTLLEVGTRLRVLDTEGDQWALATYLLEVPTSKGPGRGWLAWDSGGEAWWSDVVEAGSLWQVLPPEEQRRPRGCVSY